MRLGLSRRADYAIRVVLALAPLCDVHSVVVGAQETLLRQLAGATVADLTLPVDGRRAEGGRR